MPETTQAESGKKVNIGCEVDLEPMSEACLDFAKTWESAVESEIYKWDFHIIKSNREIWPETGVCSASTTAIYVGPHKYIDFTLESDESSASPTALEILNVLQKAYEKTKPGDKKEAIYAALSVNGNSLKKPSNPKTQDQKEKSKSHDKKEREPDNNTSEDGFEEGGSEELFPHVEDMPKNLISLNLNSGTLKFSDGWTIHLSREFYDNIYIDVTDLSPLSKLTMNKPVKALDPDDEVKLARRIRDRMENIEAAIKQRNPSSSSTGGMDKSGSGEENE